MLVVAMRASVREISRLVGREAAKLAVYMVVFLQVEVARSLSDLTQKCRSFDLRNHVMPELYKLKCSTETSSISFPIYETKLIKIFMNFSPISD